MELNETLKNQRLFMLFSSALMMVTNSCKILKEGGADTVAVEHINEAVKLISKQLDKEAMKLELELEALKDIDNLRVKMGIPRTKDEN